MVLDETQIKERKRIILDGFANYKSIAEIANAVGKSPKTIRMFCAANGIKQAYVKTCRQCGNEFETKEPLKKFCSELCESRARPKDRYAHECERCGLFFMSTSGHTKLCRSCFYITHQVRVSNYHQICAQCGKHFTGRTNARFCSDKCAHSYNAVRPTEHTCVECGNTFVASSNRKYCSASCRRRHGYKAGEFRRRALITTNGELDSDISINGVMARDGNICALCGKPVDMSDYVQTDAAFVAGNSYPSIDHIVPLARGGKHVWNNVQLAHRVCNSIKGAR